MYQPACDRLEFAVTLANTVPEPTNMHPKKSIRAVYVFGFERFNFIFMVYPPVSFQE
jgi:hypothetical protein